MTPLRGFLLPLLTVAAVACAGTHASVETVHQGDGTIRLKCQAPLVNCLSNADAVCHGDTYEVVRARDQRDHFGQQSGSSQVEVRTSEAIIRCNSAAHPLGQWDPEGLPPLRLQRPPEAEGQQPGAAEAGVVGGVGGAAAANAANGANASTANAHVCVPGATQACVGPGKCEGGQSCLPDGSGFAPCDCGTIGAPAPAPAPSPPPSNGAHTTAPAGGTRTPKSTGKAPVKAPSMPKVPEPAVPAPSPLK